MTTVKATVHNGRIDVPAPCDLPEGAEVVLMIGTASESGSMTPEEIAKTIAAMHRLEPLEIDDETAEELDAWEKKINQLGIDHCASR
jgi:hypothetical protein